MPCKVSDVLRLMKEKGAKNTDNLFSVFHAFNSDELKECACVALKEMEISTDKMTSGRFFSSGKKAIKQKVVVVVEAFRDCDYYKCLTIKEFKKFLENIEDKDEFVCIAHPKDLDDGKFRNIYNCCKEDDFDDISKDNKMRKMFGENIFYLLI